MLAKLLAQQLGHPSNITGKWVLAPLWNRRNMTLNDVALAKLDLRPDDRVLEVGFGGGYLLSRIAEVVTEGSIAGVDVSEAMVAYCQQQDGPTALTRRPNLCCGTAEALPYPAGQFDKVCTVNSVFYWDDAPRAITEIGRVLRGHGVLVLCFTCKESLQTKNFARNGLALYDPDDVKLMTEAAGFSAIATERLSDQHREFWCMTAVKVGSLDLA
jgi:ubiquinone/menaquinone biosynthesis C-methylase UbiE